MMVENFPVFFRLTFCLLFSAALHGGLAFYSWTLKPSDAQLADVPVAISLLPARNVVSPELNNVPQSAKAPLPSQRTPRTVAARKTIALPGKVETVQEKKVISKNDKQLPATEFIERVRTEPSMEASVTEEVCMLPQNSTVDSFSLPLVPEQTIVADKKVAMASVESVSKLNSSAIQSIEDGSLTGETVTAQDFTQAIPNYRSNPLPDYPYRARMKHWEGVVWLLVDVSADGLVDDLRVEQSCGHRLLDRTATRTVRRWQFTPAKRAGLPVLSQVRIPVRFDLEDD